MWTTIPKLAKASGLTEGMLRELAEEGLLPAIQNPVALRDGKKAKYLIPTAKLESFFTTVLSLEHEQLKEVLKRLGINFKQLLLDIAA